MSAIKERLHDFFKCKFCRGLFRGIDALDAGHEFDLGLPTCSDKCWRRLQGADLTQEDKELIEVYEALADEMEKRPQPQSEEDFN